ncbi:MAG: hypothetical protein CSA66_00160 [Proteobacteria bacterium]|nr:MAG: hypothetical protein CSA66_00160 [Pseudomonadota bacterium]
MTAPKVPIRAAGERRVLVTGATTPVGAALVRRLLDAGAARVIAVGAKGSDGVDRLPLDDPRLTLVHVDLSRSRSRRRLLYGVALEERVDTVADGAIHRSASTRGLRAHELNVESTRELLTLAERHPTIEAYVLRSFAEVYRVTPRLPTVLDEGHPLELGPRNPQWLRDRVEADVIACTRMGMSRLRITVLRAAECFGPDTGSQLWDYLQSRVCFRPAGFDPTVNLLSVDDAAKALSLAVLTEAQGIYNIPGADTLPLTRVIRFYGRRDYAVIEPLLYPLYALRARTIGRDFRYRLNRAKFHFSGVMDGSKAARELGYIPSHPIDWPDEAELREAAPRPTTEAP